jgi:hypothetical protein
MAASPHQLLATSYCLSLRQALSELEKMEQAASKVAQDAEGTPNYARRKLQLDALTTARQLMADCLLVGTPGQRKAAADPQLDLFGAAA